MVNPVKRDAVIAARHRDETTRFGRLFRADTAGVVRFYAEPAGR
jgi:hypothetical protein